MGRHLVPRNTQLTNLITEKNRKERTMYSFPVPMNPPPLDRPTKAEQAKRKARITLTKVWRD